MSISLALPSTSLPSSTSRPISSLSSHPLVLATLLDAHLRRSHGQDRVFGTLLGVRNPHDGSLELRNAFAVPYEVRGKGQVTIDMDHHRAMLDLHLKVTPREHVVGWFATSPSLNSFSALIHNFYTSEVASTSPSSSPSPAVHLTLDPDTLDIAAYTAAPIGLNSTQGQQGAQVAFSPVEVRIKVGEQDRAGLDLLTSNINSLSSSLSSSAHAASTSTSAAEPEVDAPLALPTPLSHLTTLLSHVTHMLDSVLEYVRAVNAGERDGDPKVGRALLETVGAVPAAGKRAAKGAAGKGEKKGGAAGEAGEEVDGFEEEFNQHLADVLMVSYLSNVIKTQSEIAGRLGLLL
ncbi:hypothetical protein JCM11251_007112 [Rhodosporidiobolus azoricus]